MTYESETTYSNENGQELTIIGKVGLRYMFCWGSLIIECLGSNIQLSSQQWLDELNLRPGKFYRNSCRCGYKSQEPFGVACPACNETATFYQGLDAFRKLPPMEDLLLGDNQ